MAETPAMPPTPAVKDASDAKPMDMSSAMDMLDEHGITEQNYKDVSDAIEAVYGEDEAPGEPSDDGAMMKEMFSSGRKR